MVVGRRREEQQILLNIVKSLPEGNIDHYSLNVFGQNMFSLLLSEECS